MSRACFFASSITGISWKAFINDWRNDYSKACTAITRSVFRSSCWKFLNIERFVCCFIVPFRFCLPFGHLHIFFCPLHIYLRFFGCSRYLEFMINIIKLVKSWMLQIGRDLNIDLHVCMHAYIHTNMYTCIHSCMHNCMCNCVFTLATCKLFVT